MKEYGHNFLSGLLAKGRIGWWEADLKKESYVCSEYISDLLELGEDGIISFEDFNKRIMKEEQRPTTVHSFDAVQQVSEAVYLIKTRKGNLWIRSKVCDQQTDEEGNVKVYGIAEVQDAPEMATAYQALQKSERLLHNIYKNLPVGIELYDKEGRLVDLNEKELEMFHIADKKALLGLNVFDNPIFPEDMKDKMRNYEDADFSFSYDFSKVGEYYHPKKRSGTIDLVVKVTTLYDDDHNPINYLLINTDRTETTVAYNKIQEFENVFEFVGNYAKVGYAYCNLCTGDGYASKSWYRNLSESEDVPVGKIIGVYDHIYAEDRLGVNEFLQNVRKGMEDKFTKRVRVIREDGSQTWTQINLLVKRYAPEEKLIEIISINYDITQLKATEEMLIKAKNKAEESDRMKSSFLANMSHEIRTPLNAIVGFSGLLPHVDNPEERDEYIKLINHNNELLLKLVDDVLDISRIEAGHISFYKEWFDLYTLIRESVTEHGQRVTPDLKLTVEKLEKDYWVELDRMRLKQLLNNLISNALKNTRQGFVSVSYEVDESGISVSVADTGRGIPEEKLEKIFDRFEKVNSFVQGAGLGLSICKSIVDKMGGVIEAESVVGKGSTFRVKLPCMVRPVEELLGEEY